MKRKIKIQRNSSIKYNPENSPHTIDEFFPAKKLLYKPKLIPIGFWFSKNDIELPFPRINSCNLSEKDKFKVIKFLNDSDHKKAGTFGYSQCRICGIINGSSDIYDDIFEWPEGLSHYVLEHNVGLPKEFVDYVLNK